MVFLFRAQSFFRFHFVGARNACSAFNRALALRSLNYVVVVARRGGRDRRALNRASKILQRNGFVGVQRARARKKRMVFLFVSFGLGFYTFRAHVFSASYRERCCAVTAVLIAISMCRERNVVSRVRSTHRTSESMINTCSRDACAVYKVCVRVRWLIEAIIY